MSVTGPKLTCRLPATTSASGPERTIQALHGHVRCWPAEAPTTCGTPALSGPVVRSYARGKGGQKWGRTRVTLGYTFDLMGMEPKCIDPTPSATSEFFNTPVFIEFLQAARLRPKTNHQFESIPTSRARHRDSTDRGHPAVVVKELREGWVVYTDE